MIGKCYLSVVSTGQRENKGILSTMIKIIVLDESQTHTIHNIALILSETIQQMILLETE